MSSFPQGAGEAIPLNALLRPLFEEGEQDHGGPMRIVNLLALMTFIASIVLLGVRG